MIFPLFGSPLNNGPRVMMAMKYCLILDLLAEKASELGSQELTEANLKRHGKSIPLFPGVEDWFERINDYAQQHGLELYHYIISSGLDAMIRGTSIGCKFRDIYACKYHYSPDSKSVTWPEQAINYTTKTQFLFRINKGIPNSWDNAAINKFIEPEDREIPFQKK